MAESETAPVLISDRDARAVMLLSLDVTRPFLPHMGLEVRGTFAWTDVMRDFVRAYRHAFGARTLQEEAPSVPDLAAFVRSRLGPVAVGVLQWWLRDIYASAPSDHSEYRSWDDVFRYARRRPDMWRQLEIHPARKDAVMQRYEAVASTKYFAELWDEASGSPLSDWDLQMYAVNAWNDDLDIPNGPESRLFLIFTDYRSRTFWDALQQELSINERERLQGTAQQLVDTTPYLTSVGALPPLVALRMEWP